MWSCGGSGDAIVLDRRRFYWPCWILTMLGVCILSIASFLGNFSEVPVLVSEWIA